MHLPDAVVQAFAPQGLLSHTQPGFQPRTGQTEMALAVARTIVHGGALVVEAGTGIGKTFAYLVPALLSGERVLVSTATKALQDQLFTRDLPVLVQALGLPLRRALLKGRSSYLCLHRMQTARQSTVLAGPKSGEASRTLALVEQWAQGTRTGDLAEMPALDERSPVIPLVTSTRDNCLGAQCPQLAQCHVYQARREALAADVVVINHHLFFADLGVRESGVAELLPSVRVVVFDEAHQLNEIGVQFLGRQLGTGQLLDCVRDLLVTGLDKARGFVNWQAVAGALEHATRALRQVAVGQGQPGSNAGGREGRWSDSAPDGVDPVAWHMALAQLARTLQAALQAVGVVQESAPDFARLQARLAALLLRVQQFAQPCSSGAVRWLDAGGRQLRMVESPLDIAQAMHAHLWGPAPGADAEEDAEAPEPADGGSPAGMALPPPAGPPSHSGPSGPLGQAPTERPRAWVFTSATLGDDASLRWFTVPCGLEGAEVLRVGSPFDYARQAALFIPPQLPRPADPGHSLQLARWVGDAAQRLGGRTLVLTTTLRALRAVGDALQVRFGVAGGLEVLVQGQAPKRQLMERFRQGAQNGLPGCVLVASATFWEGFDVPGDALQLVVIDKLPFPPPGDPLVEARSRRLEEAGRSAFNDLSLPEAAVALRQGAGRLVRHESDHGVLVVADTRLASMGYGRRLRAALPPMRRLDSQEDFDAALDALISLNALRAQPVTTPSTTGPSCP